MSGQDPVVLAVRSVGVAMAELHAAELMVQRAAVRLGREVATVVALLVALELSAHLLSEVAERVEWAAGAAARSLGPNGAPSPVDIEAVPESRECPPPPK